MCAEGAEAGPGDPGRGGESLPRDIEPDDRYPPPHTTGGAVDLFLRRAGESEPLDVTSPFPWDETSAPTAMRGLTEGAQANRRLLVQALEATGLTNYVGEWWHWSYGDSGWALRVGAQKAIYDRIPELKAGDTK